MIITKNCCICEPSELMQLAYDKFKRKHNQGQGPTPSAADRWKFLVAPGQRSDSLVLDTDYIDAAEQYPGTVDLDSPSQISVAEGVDAVIDFRFGGGYSVTGNTLTVTSVGQPGDRFATLQAAVTEIEDGTAGVPIPTADNNVWLFIDKNTIEETITLTNPYLSVEIICGDRTITIVEDFD